MVPGHNDRVDIGSTTLVLTWNEPIKKSNLNAYFEILVASNNYPRQKIWFNSTNITVSDDGLKLTVKCASYAIHKFDTQYSVTIKGAGVADISGNEYSWPASQLVTFYSGSEMAVVLQSDNAGD